MRVEPYFNPMTVEDFLAIDFGSDKKFELVEGTIRIMTGGTRGHSRVTTNILAFLRPMLRGSGCHPHGPDMGVRIGKDTLRYPDVSVFCGNSEVRERDRDLLPKTRSLSSRCCRPPCRALTRTRSWNCTGG